MTKIRLSAIAAVALVGAFSVIAHADDISTKKMSIKDNDDASKRQFQVQSSDANVALGEADDPATNGAFVHVYSATDNMCYELAAGSEWSTNGKIWKFKNKVSKNSAQIGDGKLSVKLKSDIDYSLIDDGTQGAVNVQVQFGNGGTRYCMRCTGNVKDEAKKFIAKGCAIAACASEPPACIYPAGTTTTTLPQAPPVILMGALTATTGRFNYNLQVGLPGSDAACNAAFAGTHTCTYAELQAAETAGDLDGLKDTGNTTVTSFWAIDGSHVDTLQCHSVIAWDYQTQHTGHYAEKVNLNNGPGTLGPLLSGAPDNVTCSSASWVGCCL